MFKSFLSSVFFLVFSVASGQVFNGVGVPVPSGWVFEERGGVGVLVNVDGMGGTPPYVLMPAPVVGERVVGDRFFTELCLMAPSEKLTVVLPKSTLPSNTPGQYIVSMAGPLQTDAGPMFKGCMGVVSGDRALFMALYTVNREIYQQNFPTFVKLGMGLLTNLAKASSVGTGGAGTAAGAAGAGSSAGKTGTAGTAATAGAAAGRMSAAQIVAQAWGENQGPTLQLAGVTTRAPGLEPIETFGGICPWQCLQFSASSQHRVNLHQPFPTTAQEMMDAFVTALARSPFSRSYLKPEGPAKQGTGPDGSKLLIQEFYDSGSRSSNKNFVIAIEKQGITLLVDLNYYGERDERVFELILPPVLDTLNFDAASIAKASAARQQAVKSAPDTVRNAFAAGGKAQILTRMATTIDTVNPFGGITFETRTLILLPGGIALRNVPEQDFKNINYPQLLGTNPPGQWQQNGNNIVINWGYETETLQALGNHFVSNLDDDTRQYPWNRTPTLNTTDLPGMYTYSYISGMGGSTTAGNGRLTLNANGTYSLTGTRFGGFSGANVTVGSSNNTAETGKWSFDPASYSLTLTPNGGKAYSVPAFKRGQNECTGSGCTWMIAGQEWKR